MSDSIQEKTVDSVQPKQEGEKLSKRNFFMFPLGTLGRDFLYQSRKKYDHRRKYDDLISELKRYSL